MNKNQWISYIICSEYNFYIIFIYRNKLQATNIFIKIINIIKIKYSDKIMFIKLNEKRSLEEKFATFITEKNIIFEFFASNTSIQNNYIEWKKSILLVKRRTMKIQIDLSVYLWSWIIQIVEYFMNKTFIKKCKVIMRQLPASAFSTRTWDVLNLTR